MRHETVATGWARIYASGPIDVAKQIIRGEVLRAGLCVTIEPTDFIYTGGEEAGYVVGLINYPRFPSTQEAIDARADELAEALLHGTFQHSVMVMSPTNTRWTTLRQEPGDSRG
jgi:hypothetical protein